jgi:uncharacterized membrane protein
MSPQDGAAGGNRIGAQEAADRIRILREELATEQVQAVLALTPDQQTRFDEWSRAALVTLAQQFDVDTTVSQKRVSWGMRIASTLGGLAICAALVLFVMRYWGSLSTAAQLAIAIMTLLAALAGAEFAAGRERTRYFTGLLSLLAAASFIMNLGVMGSKFNIVSPEWDLLAPGAFATVLAYRYGLRLMLVLGLALLMGYAAAAYAAHMGHQWLELSDRPEHFLLVGLLVFALPYPLKHARNADFPSVYRLVGALTVFIAILSLAEWGAPSYLPWKPVAIEGLYEFGGLILSAGAIWLGIARGWNGIVNTGATFFTIFLFTRLYRWWWDWMPNYLFFAVIGTLGIALVLIFQRLRGKMIRREIGAAA